uniref:Tumor necrosis factor receptor superfamily member 6 n=1 Tax=Gasterosteus aculeatus aculeatus TaxID=481459 RepID=G3P3R7_GASAC|nr:tumor necrosis factor receptor superfamily member 22 isoform X1 [Gasterosteus aculeatus aculeatus]
MAAASSEFPALCALLFLCVLLAESSAEGSTANSSCVDGTYGYGGRSCCLCSAGHYLKEHCTANLQHGKCEHCPPNTYSIQPNSLRSCELCSSCSQPNANLEVEEACTPARDAKCRCKKDHYCSSDGTEKCRICHPCEECPEGIKVACTANNNTVCGQTEGVNKTGIIIGLVSIVVIGLLLVGFFMLKRHLGKRNGNMDVTSAPDVEMQPLKAPVVDLQPYLPDIARIIGWNDAKAIATRSGIQNAVIESCLLNHPNDSLEQALELLNIWVEKQGKEASNILVKSLQDLDKRGKAEKIIELLP